jgi:hypothetical protein
MTTPKLETGLAIAAVLAACKADAPARGGRLAELAGTVVEVSVRGDVLVVRLDARGCPAVAPGTRADVNGAAMTRVEDADTGFGVEARGCSGRWTLASKQLPKGNVVLTIADDASKLVVETLPLTQKAGFKLVSRPSLTAARPGETVFAEAHGPAASKLVRAEVAVSTRRGEKFKLPASDITVGGGTVGFTLPSSSPGDAGTEALNGELTVSAEADAVVRCEGVVRCAAPVRAATSFALAIRPVSGEK